MRIRRCHVVFALLTVVVGWAFLPSLGHMPRGDQLNYLADTARLRGAGQTVFETYSLTRTREFGQGDEILFRPSFYLTLEVERWAHGYQFARWQFDGVALHLFALAALYRLLMRFCGAMTALVLTLQMGVSFASMESVIYSNIHAYLIFAICLMTALLHAWRMTEDGGGPLRSPWIAALCVAIGVTCYESMALLACCLAAFVAFCPTGRDGPAMDSVTVRRIRSLCMVAPVVLYALWSAGDFWLFRSRYPDGEIIQSSLAPWPTLRNLVVALAWWSAFGVAATSATVYVHPFEKGAAHPSPTIFSMWIEPDAWDWVSAIGSFAAIGILLAIALPVLRGGLGRRHRVFALCLLAMILVYTLVIVIGRMNPIGMGAAICANTHYVYPFWMLSTVLAGVLIGRVEEGGRGRALTLLFCGLVLGVALSNAVRIHRQCERLSRDSSRLRETVGRIEEMKKFRTCGEIRAWIRSLDGDANPPVPWMWRRGVPAGAHTYTFLGALYPEFSDEPSE